jgi:hypothetical protein
MPDERLVIKLRGILFAAVLAGCGGGSNPATVAPSNSARGAVQSFMDAVADSNLAQMANFWGSTGGPAARTGQPPDYERRIAIMHAYLRNESHRIVSDTPDAAGTRHALQVEIRRQLCSWIVPFTALKLGDGTWIVSQVDLTAAGNPAQPCVPGAQKDTSAQE